MKESLHGHRSDPLSCPGAAECCCAGSEGGTSGGEPEDAMRTTAGASVRSQTHNQLTSFLCLYFLAASSKVRACSCFCRYTTCISSCLLFSFWACRARAKALLLVFRETLKKEELSGGRVNYISLQHFFSSSTRCCEAQRQTDWESCFWSWMLQLKSAWKVSAASLPSQETPPAPPVSQQTLKKNNRLVWNISSTRTCWGSVLLS